MIGLVANQRDDAIDPLSASRSATATRLTFNHDGSLDPYLQHPIATTDSTAGRGPSFERHAGLSRALSKARLSTG